MTSPVAGNAKRLLAATRNVDGRDVPALPAFKWLGGPNAPPWWRSDLIRSEWGTVFGVYENGAEGANSVLVAEEAIIVLDGSARPTRWVRYADVEKWDLLSKEPVSRYLVIWRHDGTHVEVPFFAREGDAFSFVQFLIAALRAR